MLTPSMIEIPEAKKERVVAEPERATHIER